MKNGGFLNFVEEQIRDAEKVGKGLFFNPEKGVIERDAVFGAFAHLRFEKLARGVQKAPGTAGKVRDRVADFERNVLRHEIRQGARRVVLAGAPGVLEFSEDRFVNGAESVRFLRIREVAFVDEFQTLPKRHAVFGVVVNVFEDSFDDGLALGAVRREVEVLQRRKELVVDEIK